MPTAPTRREFCSFACQAASVIAVGAATACGGSPTSPSTSAPPLSTVNGSVTGPDYFCHRRCGLSSRCRWIGRHGADRPRRLPARPHGQDAFNALTATCTHEACTITGFAAPQFVCPCHGSRYTTAGAVVNGPATRGLTSYPTQFANGVLTFTV